MMDKYYSYRIKATTSTGQFGEYSEDGEEWGEDFILTTGGEITAVDEFDDESVAGRFKTVYVEFERARGGMQLLDVLDSDGDLYPFAEIIGRNGFCSTTMKKLGLKSMRGDLLVVQEISLFPDFRGRGLGKIVLSRIIQCFGRGASVVALIPAPLQFSNYKEDAEWFAGMHFELFKRKQDENVAKKHLEEFYESIGFVKVGKTDIMAKAINK